MNITIYSWNIERINPIIGDDEDGNRLEILTGDRTETLLFINRDQAQAIRKVLDVLYPPSPGPSDQRYTAQGGVHQEPSVQSTPA